VRTGLLGLFSIGMLAESSSSAPHPICKQHAELLKRDHIRIGARIDTANPVLAKQFRRALNFWTTVIDLNWYEDNSDACSLQLTDAPHGFLDPSIAAQAQHPGTSEFHGLIEFNAALTLTETETYYYSVHEIGHLLGLKHNPSHRSVMYFDDARGPERLDSTDLIALATIHKLRIGSTRRAIYLQQSVWNHVPDLGQVREQLLLNRFHGGFMTMLGTGKRAPEARTPAQTVSHAEPTYGVGVLTRGIITAQDASRGGSPNL
jgi:Matrixin